MQMIQESMLKIIYDSLHLQYYTRVSEVEIDENEKVGEDENNRLTEDNEDFRSVSEIVDYFSTLRSSESSEGTHTPAAFTDLSRAFSRSSAPSSSNALSLNQPHLQPHASVQATDAIGQQASGATASRMIGLDLDEANILSEEVGRRRAPRRQAYATALMREASGDISTFHETFSAFSLAKDFQPASVQIIVASATILKLHRDSLPPESKNFRQLTDHPHAAGFHLAIQTKITSLASKGT